MKLDRFGIVESNENKKVNDTIENKDGKYTVYIGDCEKVLERMAYENKRVDLIVTSPPYFIMRGTVEYNSYEAYLEKMKRIFENARRVLKPGRILVVNVGDYLINGKRLFIGADFIKLLQEIGYEVFDNIIWAKPKGYMNDAGKRAGMFIKTKMPMYYKPNNTYEHMILSINGKEMTRCNESCIGKDNYYKSKVSDEIFKKHLKDYTNDIWNISPKGSKWHPAPFPIDIPYKFILLYSYYGDTVLDPFHGSGTTMRAASMLGRNAIGIEMNENYVKRFKSEFDKDLEVIK